MTVPLSAGAETTDYGDTWQEAESVTVPMTLTGEITPSGDIDYFSFAAVSGITYIMEATLGSITDLRMHFLGTDGTTILDYDLTTGTGTSSTITWTCPTNGTYYVEIDGTDSNFSGTYSL